MSIVQVRAGRQLASDIFRQHSTQAMQKKVTSCHLWSLQTSLGICTVVYHSCKHNANGERAVL